MNHKYFSAFRALTFVLSILFFASFAKAQAIEPDEQMLRQMTAYARKTENALNRPRPRLVTASATIEVPDLAVSESIARPDAATLRLEHLAFDWLNDQRAGQGLKPLKWNDEVARLARYHSDNMARGKYFSHQEPDGSMVNNRAEFFGLNDWQSIGENIAFNRGFKLPAESACQQWMNSPKHRENILDNHWTEAGIGMAIAPDGSYYFTEVFIER